MSNRTVVMPPADTSLKTLAVRSAIWTIAGYGGVMTLRFGGNLVLARLLFPAAFGLSSIIWVFMTGLAMFSDLGLGPNIVRSPRGDCPDFLNTAWTLQVARGLTLWGCSAAIAGPVSHFYQSPELALMLPVAGLTAIFQGLSSTAIHTCSRRLQLGAMISMELVTGAVGLIVMIGLALVWPSPWALVLGSVASSLVKAILTYQLPGRIRHRLHWEPAASRELFSFGRWIFLNTLLTFLAVQTDRLFLGRLAGMRELGIYSVAVALATVPRDIMNQLFNRVIFPMFSQLRDRSEGQEKIRMARGWLLLLIGPVCAVLAAAAPVLIDLLYDARYAQAGSILAILAVGTWFQVVTSSYFNVILVAGVPQYSSVGYALKFAMLLGLTFPVYQAHGLLGVAALGAISELGVMIPTGIGAYRLGAVSLRKDLTIHLLVFSLIPTTSALLSLGRQWPWATAVIALLVMVVGVAALPWWRLVRGILSVSRSLP